MNPYACYDAINTKLHARRRALLKKRDWERILEFKTVQQMIDFLKKQYGYEKLINEFKLEEVHRTQLEVKLHRYIVLEIEKILYYFSGNYSNFFKCLLMGYEISDLQLILRGISRQENMDEIEEHFVHSEKHTKLSYTKLVAAKNVSQFIEALQGSIYYDELKTMVQEDAIKREFHMEMKLNMVLYKALIVASKKLENKDRLIAKKIIGTQIDYSNAQWIYRATKYYDISPEEILIYILPGGNRLTYAKLKRLCYCKNLDAFRDLADKYLEYSIFHEKNDIFLEKAIDTRIYSMLLNKGNNTIQAPLSYITILAIQLKDLIAVTEGIRYGLPKEEIKKYLVHTL